MALAVAADYVIASSGSVLNMHYKKMGLYGSEFWSYSLKKRVGLKHTNDLVEGCEPITGSQALELGLVDDVIQQFENFDGNLHQMVLSMSKHISNLQASKINLV